jgi:hypothetical protein
LSISLLAIRAFLNALVAGLLSRRVVEAGDNTLRSGRSLEHAGEYHAGDSQRPPEAQSRAGDAVQEAWLLHLKAACEAGYYKTEGQETIFRRWDKVCTDCSFWLDDFCLLRSCQRLPVADTCTFFHESRSLDPQGAAGSCTVNR